MVSENKGNPFVDLFFFVLKEVVVSRKDILFFDTSCVNFIDGWILLGCSKKFIKNFIAMYPFHVNVIYKSEP